MSDKVNIIGYPRVGKNREYKWVIEKYWRGDSTIEDVLEVSDNLIKNNWEMQSKNGAETVLAGDFSFYDQVLDTVTHLGIPQKRFGYTSHENLETYFKASRGGSVNSKDEPPLDMTKWFDTNYHYLVPEIDWSLDFEPNIFRYKYESELAKSKNISCRPKIIGPATLLTLSKEKGIDDKKINKIVNAYLELFSMLEEIGFKEVLLDEGCVGVGKHMVEDDAFSSLKLLIQKSNLKIHLLGYFGKYEGFLDEILDSNIESIHLDLCYEGFSKEEILNIASKKDVVLGLINGRTIWKSNLDAKISNLIDLGIDNFSISSSCSMLHVPYSLENEDGLDINLKNILSFAEEKLHELRILNSSITNNNDLSEISEYEGKRLVSDKALVGRVVEDVRRRISDLSDDDFIRSEDREIRLEKQSKALNIPLLPTTTIGSFPQTLNTRNLRKQFKSGEISIDEYNSGLKEIITETVEIQENLGIDVLVHGEAERNDMVEYFGELLEGFAFSKFGWVQSYGSRCVKPPIIFGDVHRTKSMTVDWSVFAQSLTNKNMKGMLTGPVTILQWSFYRDDISKKEVAYQIGLALRDEVIDLEKNNIKIIQIDEPAIREGLPLNSKFKDEYLDWAVNSFKLASSGVETTTQIHSHMCYSEFDEILDAINALDVDVLSIEASRSGMDLVNPTLKEKYKGAIGPGVYDIHSPLVLQGVDAENRVGELIKSLDLNKVWINPDCGLKTRGWPEVKESLTNMVEATKKAKEKL